MTEPEDLEEDLFADLYGPPSQWRSAPDSNTQNSRYDGNETNQVTSAGVVDSSAEANASSTAIQANEFPNDGGPEGSQDNIGQDNYQAQDIGGAQGYQGNNITQDINAQSGDDTPSNEAENQGTGIKEDG